MNDKKSDNSAKAPEAGPKTAPESGKGGNWSDLSMRLVSAIILAAVVLLITYSNHMLFAALLAVGAGVASWEWGAMVRKAEGVDELLVLQLISVLIAGGVALSGRYEVAALILVVGPAMKFIISDDKQAGNLGLSLLGVPYIGLPLLAMLWLRGDPAYGWQAIFYLFVVVWSVDVFAYLTGRSIGGPKLAPKISPKKTWSGFLGGVGCGALAGMWFSVALGGTSPLILGVISLIVGVMSQIGDLFVSVLKRRFDIKDMSNLIPGHGGLLDRIDGLLFGAATAAAIALAFGHGTPAEALLIWR